VEIANRTFKRRLTALQLAKGTSYWVELLLELVCTINTTTSSALPRCKTLYEVWFGWKPHWVSRIGELDNYDDDNSDQDDDNDDDIDPSQDLVLTEIETQVAANNAQLHAQMIKANSGCSPIFELGTIVTLKIPSKLRLNIKSVRLPVRVLEYKNGQYIVQS
jgi:hypothetical protein